MMPLSWQWRMYAWQTLMSVETCAQWTQTALCATSSWSSTRFRLPALTHPIPGWTAVWRSGNKCLSYTANRVVSSENFHFQASWALQLMWYLVQKIITYTQTHRQNRVHNQPPLNDWRTCRQFAVGHCCPLGVNTKISGIFLTFPEISAEIC